MKILALDQSVSKTGFGYFDNGKLKDYGIIRNNVKSDRLGFMASQIKRLVEYLPEIDLLVIEDVQTQSNVATMKLLAELKGMLEYMAKIDLDIAVAVLEPSKWRKSLGFKQGRVKRDDLKEQALDYVQSKYRIDVAEDIAEAICIGSVAVESVKDGREKHL